MDTSTRETLPVANWCQGLTHCHRRLEPRRLHTIVTITPQRRVIRLFLLDSNPLSTTAVADWSLATRPPHPQIPRPRHGGSGDLHSRLTAELVEISGNRGKGEGIDDGRWKGWVGIGCPAAMPDSRRFRFKLSPNQAAIGITRLHQLPPATILPDPRRQLRRATHPR
ncbi:hypothetical protein DVH24_003518 [Malus domestica]|uniref:Uncharacterized protein n=1 Tax=Malus domestica TaxID=3750 RepID=A0A498IIJ0_MALDO|nr:hypothetical protein DVH24_003518 [Malus domestica]